jgi:hypothetical protein
MKNRLIITNEEKNRILSIHKIAINESNMSKFLKKSLVIKEQDLDNAPSEKNSPPLKNKEKIDNVKEKGQEIIDKIKNVKDEVIDDPNEDGNEFSRYIDMLKKDPENDGTMLNRKKTPGQTRIENAWQSVTIYAIQNNLKSHTETTGTHEEAKTYYDINGTKFYEDGYKMGADKKLVPYFEDDDALTIVNKTETKPVTTPTPTVIKKPTYTSTEDKDF